MNRHQFEEEFNEKIKSTVGNQPWHAHVTANMYKLSDEALHYIVQNDDNYFFGSWMVEKAIDLTIFDEIVLGVKRADQRQGYEKASRVNPRRRR